MYRELISNMLELYGSGCEIYLPGQTAAMETNAFITPFNYKSGSFAATEYTASGKLLVDCYRYVGKVTPDLELLPKGSRIVCGTRVYRVESSEIYRFKNEDIYCRAVLRLFEGGNIYD